MKAYVFRFKSQSVFTTTHKVLAVVLVDYCMAVCLSAMTAVESHPKAS